MYNISKRIKAKCESVKRIAYQQNQRKKIKNRLSGKKNEKRKNKTLFALMTCNSYKSSMVRALANEFTLQFAKSLLY